MTQSLSLSELASLIEAAHELGIDGPRPGEAAEVFAARVAAALGAHVRCERSKKVLGVLARAGLVLLTGISLL